MFVNAHIAINADVLYSEIVHTHTHAHTHSLTHTHTHNTVFLQTPLHARKEAYFPLCRCVLSFSKLMSHQQRSQPHNITETDTFD
jgi:hypothetical protein